MADLWDWYCGELDDDLMTFARSLADHGVRAAILSNSADGARREEEQRYRFAEVFDPIVYSHEVGLAKPDPAVYELTARRLGVRPEACVHVDDTGACVEAARTAGMQGVLHVDTPTTVRELRRLLVG